MAAALIMMVGVVRAQDEPVFTTTMTEGGNGLPIAVTVGGNPEGPGILFVHGFMASTLHWQKQMTAALADDFKLAFVDMRGHGASSKPAEAEHYLDPALYADDIAAAIKAAELRKPLLVGWSYGGLFIMDYLRHYSRDSVSGVVLAGSTAGLLPPPPASAGDPGAPGQDRALPLGESHDYQHLDRWLSGVSDSGRGIDRERNQLPAHLSHASPSLCASGPPRAARG